jgi:hypothetical protein
MGASEDQNASVIKVLLLILVSCKLNIAIFIFMLIVPNFCVQILFTLIVSCQNINRLFLLFSGYVLMLSTRIIW